MKRLLTALVSGVLLAGCSAPATATAPPTSAPDATSQTAAAGQRFPDIVGVEADRNGSAYSFAVTVSSPYDTPDRYADAFRVRGEDGAVFGVRELTHDHAAEQPFTRQTTVEIPDEVDEITVEGRDQVSGYGGDTVTVTVPRDG